MAKIFWIKKDFECKMLFRGDIHPTLKSSQQFLVKLKLKKHRKEKAEKDLKRQIEIIPLYQDMFVGEKSILGINIFNIN